MTYLSNPKMQQYWCRDKEQVASKGQFWGPEIVLSPLLSLCLLPNAVLTPHVGPFITNPLRTSISVAILISYGKKVTSTLDKGIHAPFSQWGPS